MAACNLYNAATICTTQAPICFSRRKNSNGSRTHATCVTWSAASGQEWALHGRRALHVLPGQSCGQLRALCSRSNRLVVKRYACAALVLAYLGATYKKKNWNCNGCMHMRLQPCMQTDLTLACDALIVTEHAMVGLKIALENSG
jgi:hypothetical protein